VEWIVNIKNCACRVLCGLAVFFLGHVDAIATTSPTQVYLYSSPLTKAFFAANGSNYETLKVKWRVYLNRSDKGYHEVSRSDLHEEKGYREVSRADLLAGLKPGVLILGSAALLDDQERQAVHAFAQKGGSLMLTWGTGVRNATGRWTGYGFIEDLLDIQVVGKVEAADDDNFLNTFGDSPLTSGLPAGSRMFLGLVGETPLRVKGKWLAGRYANWVRSPSDPATNGAVAFAEKNGSRRIFLGFSEASWEFDGRLELPKALDTMMAWLKHEPRVFESAWPFGRLSAQLLEMDTEDRYPNAINFARELDKAGIRGTFYSLTSVAKNYPELVRQLAEKHEIGYHAEVHVGFKGKNTDEQSTRLNTMVRDMGEIIGTRALGRISGFRAPTESWDATTEKLLRKKGIRHHVTDPSSSDARLPFFSKSEPELSPEDAIVVLPRTQMDDLNYLAMKLDNQAAAKLIARDFDYLHESGSLGVLSVHSQNYGENGLMTELTPPYIRRLQEHRAEVWSASGEEIEAWWRNRARVHVKAPSKGWTDKGFQLLVDPAGAGKGITLFVLHPVMGKGVKAVVTTAAGQPVPTIQRIDDFRTALVFKDSIKPGMYDYAIQFE
jgi:peptidoglycan/xylan/chitin deacetylase (PgdA/CDA1 family)